MISKIAQNPWVTLNQRFLLSTSILAFRNRAGKAPINAQKAKNEAKIIETISMTLRKVNTDEEPGNIVRTPAITNVIPH